MARKIKAQIEKIKVWIKIMYYGWNKLKYVCKNKIWIE